ncbi:hypothetical protein DA792_03485 [Celeribacter baekdonensis]|uniref:Uncharacterized protein n=1 Tax=Celeribacter baekdonensis TaxID=875171 RepID=A0A2R4LZI2_9RHOB|nr:hypothetical protein DA792_03485 [Celeribacter baekdonensis]
MNFFAPNVLRFSPKIQKPHNFVGQGDIRQNAALRRSQSDSGRLPLGEASIALMQKGPAIKQGLFKVLIALKASHLSPVSG